MGIAQSDGEGSVGIGVAKPNHQVLPVEGRQGHRFPATARSDTHSHAKDGTPHSPELGGYPLT